MKRHTSSRQPSALIARPGPFDFPLSRPAMLCSTCYTLPVFCQFFVATRLRIGASLSLVLSGSCHYSADARGSINAPLLQRETAARTTNSRCITSEFYEFSRRMLEFIFSQITHVRIISAMFKAHHCVMGVNFFQKAIKVSHSIMLIDIDIYSKPHPSRRRGADGKTLFTLLSIHTHTIPNPSHGCKRIQQGARSSGSRWACRSMPAAAPDSFHWFPLAVS